MHELGIMANVLDIALEYAEKNDANKIHAINLEVGEYSGVIPKLAQDFFRYMAKGTIAKDATIKITKVPMRVKCKECESISEVSAADMLACPKCGSDDTELYFTSRGWRIESMEVE